MFKSALSIYTASSLIASAAAYKSNSANSDTLYLTGVFAPPVQVGVPVSAANAAPVHGDKLENTLVGPNAAPVNPTRAVIQTQPGVNNAQLVTNFDVNAQKKGADLETGDVLLRPVFVKVNELSVRELKESIKEGSMLGDLDLSAMTSGSTPDQWKNLRKPEMVTSGVARKLGKLGLHLKLDGNFNSFSDEERPFGYIEPCFGPKDKQEEEITKRNTVISFKKDSDDGEGSSRDIKPSKECMYCMETSKNCGNFDKKYWEASTTNSAKNPFVVSLTQASDATNTLEFEVNGRKWNAESTVDRMTVHRMWIRFSDTGSSASKNQLIYVNKKVRGVKTYEAQEKVELPDSLLPTSKFSVVIEAGIAPQSPCGMGYAMCIDGPLLGMDSAVCPSNSDDMDTCKLMCQCPCRCAFGCIHGLTSKTMRESDHAVGAARPLCFPCVERTPENKMARSTRNGTGKLVAFLFFILYISMASFFADLAGAFGAKAQQGMDGFNNMLGRGCEDSCRDVYQECKGAEYKSIFTKRQRQKTQRHKSCEDRGECAEAKKAACATNTDCGSETYPVAALVCPVTSSSTGASGESGRRLRGNRKN